MNRELTDTGEVNSTLVPTVTQMSSSPDLTTLIPLCSTATVILFGGNKNTCRLLGFQSKTERCWLGT